MTAILRTVLTITLLQYAASDNADHKTTFFTNHTTAAAVTSTTSAATTTTTTTATPCVECPNDWTDPDTCGSCTFTAGKFCSWKNSKYAQKQWEAAGDGWIEVDTDMSGNQKAILTSPVMCHLRGDVICLKFRYSFSIWKNGMLTLQVCHINCTAIFVAFRSNSGNKWHDQSVEFIAEGNLQIHFIGNKTSNDFGPESDIFLDYIEYKRESCNGSPIRVSTTTVETTDPAGTFTTKTVSSTSSVSSRDQDNNIDWTTLRSLVTKDMAEGRSGNDSGKRTFTTDIDSSTSIVSSRDQDNNTDWTTLRPLVTKDLAEGRSGNDILWPDTGDSEKETRNDTEEKTTAVAKIVAPVVVGLLLVIVGIAIAIVWRRRREKSRMAAGGAQHSGVQYQRNHSVVMVNNDLYYSMDMAEPVPDVMVNNDLYCSMDDAGPVPNNGVDYGPNRQSDAAEKTPTPPETLSSSSPLLTTRSSTATAPQEDRRRTRASAEQNGGTADAAMATGREAGTGNDADVTYANTGAVPADDDDEYSHLDIGQRASHRRNTCPPDDTYDRACV